MDVWASLAGRDPKDVALGMSLNSQVPLTMDQKCYVVLRELWQSYLETRSDGSVNLSTTSPLLPDF